MLPPAGSYPRSIVGAPRAHGFSPWSARGSYVLFCVPFWGKTWGGPRFRTIAVLYGRCCELDQTNTVGLDYLVGPHQGQNDGLCLVLRRKSAPCEAPLHVPLSPPKMTYHSF